LDVTQFFKFRVMIWYLHPHFLFLIHFSGKLLSQQLPKTKIYQKNDMMNKKAVCSMLKLWTPSRKGSVHWLTGCAADTILLMSSVYLWGYWNSWHWLGLGLETRTLHNLPSIMKKINVFYSLQWNFLCHTTSRVTVECCDWVQSLNKWKQSNEIPPSPNMWWSNTSLDATPLDGDGHLVFACSDFQVIWGRQVI
jgi:hypothetical protein